MSASLVEWIGGARLPALLVETAVQGAVVLAAALAVFRSRRRASAAQCHFGLTLALIGTLGLPLFRLLTPAAGLPGAIASNPLPSVVGTLPDVRGDDRVLHGPAPSGATHAGEMRTGLATGPVASLRAPGRAAFPAARQPALPASNAPDALRQPAAPRGRVLVLAWLVGLLLVLLPMASGALRLRTWARRTSGELGPAWRATRDALASTRREVAWVRLLQTAPGSMPMTWGVWRPTIALPADGESWPEVRRRDVLLHELAHVMRRDCLTHALARLACAVRWYDPFAWLALRRMRLERERACDDLVLSTGCEAATYAESLVAIARQAGQRPAAALAGLAMARRTHLHARVGSLLARGRNRTALTRRHGVVATLAIVAVLASASSLRARSAGHEALAAPFPSSAPMTIHAESGEPVSRSRVEEVAASAASRRSAAPVAIGVTRQGGGPVVCDTSTGRRTRRSTNYNISSRSNESVWQVHWSTNGCALVIQARGDVEWNDDLTDVRTLSPGGSIAIEEDDGRTVRRYVVRSRNGTLERTYTVDDDARPFDDMARAWLGQVLVALDRRTAFAAEVRLPRILEREGVDGALREIERVEGDYAQRVYYSKLLALRELNAGELQRALAASARSIESDYEMAELLIALARERSFDAGAYPAYVDALGTIASAYELRRAASVMLARDDLPAAAVRGILQAAAAIDSDYEKAELLVTMGRRYAIDAETRPIYAEGLRSIRGAHERRRVMDVILSGSTLDSATLRALVAATRDMRGDYELAEVLLRLGRSGAATLAAEEYFAAARQIRGDYEKSRVLSALADRDDLTGPVVLEVLELAGTIRSDYECASVLVAVARRQALGDEARGAFERAAGTIDSEHEYGRAMSALRRAR